MPPPTYSTVVSADVNFNAVDNVSTQTLNESTSLNYSTILPNGSGASGISVASFESGSLVAGEERVFDLQAFPKDVFGGSFNINFTGVRAMIVENRMTSGDNTDITLKATGATAFDAPFGGTAGGYLLHAGGVFMYTNIASGDIVSASAKDFTISGNVSGPTEYSIIIAGVSGA